MRRAWAATWHWVESTVRLLRPEFWVVSVFPAWVGWALATHQAFPSQDFFLDVARQAASGDVGGFQAVLAWPLEHMRATLALVALGPLLGGSIMITNDYFDRQADVFNPKKTRSPLVAGTANVARAKALMVLLTALTLLVGFYVHPGFGVLLALGEALSFAYSAPPVRLKARPFGDILGNAIGYGGIATLAGWGLGGGWDQPFPLGGMAIVMTSIAAGYLPTVMMDRESDRAVGLRTTAVVYGLRASWILGFECLLAANVLVLGLTALGTYVPRGFVWWQLPFFALEFYAYLVFARRTDPKDLFVGGGLATAGFFGNLAAFLMVYGGVVEL